ncbi:hydroxyethylthiazole kinase [Rossellomorea marisflavi]|uniref:hydroxyethylthiazole kinase n=1 Tax=Rossellomorea marisflavi TaxID=189381 RepID=UPI003ADDE49F
MGMLELVEKLRTDRPLVHNITNAVVTNFTANGLLALGASPVMAYAEEEVEEMAGIADALLLNIGTLSSDVVRSMILAGKAANRKGIPVVLDPVGAGATTFRTEMTALILKEVDVSIIRGNAGEIASILGEHWTMRGVDSGDGDGDRTALAVKASREFACIVILTGNVDVVTDGTTVYRIRNGHPIMTQVTGTGCLLSSVAAAFAAVGHEPLQSAVAAVASYGVAAEKAERHSNGPGSFCSSFLDELSRLQPDDEKAFNVEKGEA